MLISLIAAMADDRTIGIENRLPWRLPADMRWFRQHTLGKPVLMGRKTFESLGSRPLPQRTNIVLTRDPDFQAPEARVAHSIEEALAVAGEADEVMVIGGAAFYQEMLPRADRLYLTIVHDSFNGDAWFPAYDVGEWEEVLREEHSADERNPHAYTFLILQRG